MGKYRIIEDVFNAGGYESLDNMFHDVRMPPSATKEMTKREKLIWKRFLAWRWKKQHPDFVKKQNRYYMKKYQKEKPFIAICKKCGCEFNAPRKYYKICDKCRKLPTKTELLKKAILERKKQRELDREEAKFWYSQGMTQEVIALDFGVSQKTISNWVNDKK